MQKVTDYARVLNLLETGATDTAFGFSIAMDIPEPSVRRIVHELRIDGYNVETTRKGYRLVN